MKSEIVSKLICALEYCKQIIKKPFPCIQEEFGFKVTRDRLSGLDLKANVYGMDGRPKHSSSYIDKAV